MATRCLWSLCAVLLLTGQVVAADLERWPDGSLKGPDRAVPMPLLESPPSVEDNSDQIRIQSFSELELIENPEEAPWPFVCKLFMMFRDTQGLPRWMEGSGALIDATHVLTAGHCLYFKGAPVGTDYALTGWAEVVQVIPAYHNEVQPFGYALWTPDMPVELSDKWTKDMNSDYDIGVIQIDRPMGIIAGWMDYSSQDDPGFFTGNEFHSAGYPGELPYDGELMYYWHGRFDDTGCVNSQWLSNSLILHQMCYGGQSGSAAYDQTDSGRTAYGVLSHKRDGDSHFVRITPEARGRFADLIESDASPVFDMIPLFVQTTSPTIQPGGQVTGGSFHIFNTSLASWSGRINLFWYLSNDKEISEIDTIIRESYLDWSFGPKSSVHVTAGSPPLIPWSTPSGHYWIGVKVRTSDADSENNYTSVQDVAPIIVGVNKLANDTPLTYGQGPQIYAFDVTSSDWCCVGMRSPANYVLRLDDNTDMIGAYIISRLGDQRITIAVVNGHQKGDLTHFARVGEMVGSNYTVEAAWQIPDLTIGEERADSIDAGEVHQMYEAYLQANKSYEVAVDLASGGADLSVGVFEPTLHYGTTANFRWSSDQSGARGDESVSFTPTSTGSYGIVVVNMNEKAAEYSIVVREK